MKPVTKILNEQDKILFDKAIKFYFFARQQDIRKLNSALRKRVSYCGQIAYSLIITYIREGNLKVEYMDFLNEELKTLLSADSSLFKKLQIKPSEIDEIELSKKVSFAVMDEDIGQKILIEYIPSEKKVTLRT